MKKHIFTTILTILMLLSMLAPMAYATETTAATDAAETTEATQAPEETTEPAGTTGETKAPEETKPPLSTATGGTCGEGLTWVFENGRLTISGSGAMDDGCPWEYHKDNITSVSLTGGVTYIGAEAFADCDSLTSIDFGGSLKEIGPRAFQDCDAIKTITLPDSFRKFGEEAFEGTGSLTTVYCSGPMPSFKGNCLWNGNYVTVHYPVNSPWPEAEVLRLVSNFNGRLSIITGDTTITYEDTTQPTTAPTTVPTTAPATEPTAAPTTEPATAPTTAPTSAPETTAPAPVETAPAQTEMEETQVPDLTEPVEEEEKKPLSGTIIGTILVAGCLTFFLIGALIFRAVSRKGGKYAG